MPNNTGGRPRWIYAFLATQRVPPGSRLSAWLHGESVMNGEYRGRRAQNDRLASEEDTEALPTSRYHFENCTPAVRSPSSTRSVIDPIQSPINFSRPLRSDGSRSCSDIQEHYVHPAFGSPVLIEPPKERKRGRGRRQPAKHSINAPRPTFFNSQDPQVRRKSIGTLISGAFLIIVLTTCNPPRIRCSIESCVT